MKDKIKLNSIDDIKHFFKNNPIPIHYVSLSNANLFNINQWVNNFNYISVESFFSKTLDCTTSPLNTHHTLKTNKIFANLVLSDRNFISTLKNKYPKIKLVFLTYNNETDVLLKKNKLQSLNVPASIFEDLNNKIKVIPIVESLNIPVIPYIISKIHNYSQLNKYSSRLGNKLVIQAPFGSSGEGTFFIKNKKDFEYHKNNLVNQSSMKIMKEINCKQFGIDACSTRKGTIVGPVMTDLIGFPELTNYKGGWCGNEILKNSLDSDNMNKIFQYTKKIGNHLYKNKNFRGCFTIDYLLDKDTNTMYFGEINPRISGAGFLTNQVLNPNGIPIFLFHLLEFLDIEFDINVEKLNEYWEEYNGGCFSQLILNNTNRNILTTNNFRSGIWKITKDFILYDRPATNINEIKDPEEIFVLSTPHNNIIEENDFIARLAFCSRAMNSDYQLTNATQKLIKLVLNRLSSEKLDSL